MKEGVYETVVLHCTKVDTEPSNFATLDRISASSRKVLGLELSTTQ
jgi:hypothetical protein